MRHFFLLDPDFGKRYDVSTMTYDNDYHSDHRPVLLYPDEIAAIRAEAYEHGYTQGKIDEFNEWWKNHLEGEKRHFESVVAIVEAVDEGRITLSDLGRGSLIKR